ncbi:hypothetical protein DHB74_04650 [Pseudomonas sp. G11-1]|jgi:membrane-bound metal-dependent hydrolase YbcI (DUF457 family)|uniref:Uncharacterized protein n=1 Tax=Halopseudomonas bauzanensis TaxID=653930 RepID=A0A1H9NTY3_9GAMM|nr:MULTISPECIES: hypothetical protein [Halopseudomonas]MCO5785641.1 hypothetical protein [Pseudomonas sp. G11-1]MCO5788255.1 hypothetical protein [Pseudomonas sp. G11-2]WGK61235.1 hypothetical protein QAO71_14455 [Halopseudomonas sp. SMJS2]SER39382.1 hypothetical protein SAMN05216589_0421 [Halopseudomonas bauzanensis]SFL78431.1 hypothetical protein SAMN04487855_1203 [Halopseudomonas bauzanensis]
MHNMITAGLAFLLWGSWAWLANQTSDPAHALLAGLLQGAASAIITLLMAAIVTRLFHRISSRPLAISLPPLLVVSVSTSALYLLHWLSQTPNLWLTIAPPSCTALIFCIYLTLRLAYQSPSPTPSSEPSP